MFDTMDPAFDSGDFDCPEVSDELPDPELEAAGWQALDELEAARDRIDDLDADATLARLAGGQRRANLVLAEQLALAAHWADMHAALDCPVMLPGGERLVRLGGVGTPEVAEFAPAELGAVLGVCDNAASSLIADALDLRHRFPMLWDMVQVGAVRVWVARKAAERARKMPKEAAAKVDRKISTVAGTLSWGRLRKVLDAAMLTADPPNALSDAEQAAADAGAWMGEEVEHGYGSMFIKAAAGDLKAFDEALDLISRALKILGDTGTPDQRRAKAVGIIANPRVAQELVAEAEQLRQTQRDAAAGRCTDDHATGDESVSRADRRPCVFGPATLYYHLSKETLDAILDGEPFGGASVVRVEDIGPVIAEQVRQWLGHSSVTLKPVIDVPGMPAVDRYEVPDRISEAIGLVNPGDYFPYGTSTSRRQDNEHTKPYVPIDEGGPPGQTDPAKMGKMTRHHHRVKTFCAGWGVTQLGPSLWLWRSPHGYYFLVDHTGTTPLGKL